MFPAFFCKKKDEILDQVLGVFLYTLLHALENNKFHSDYLLDEWRH